MGKGKGRGAQKLQPGATPLGTPVKAPPINKGKGAKPIESTPTPAASARDKRANTDESKKEPGQVEQGREKAARPMFSPAKKAAGLMPGRRPKQEKAKAPTKCR